MPIHLHHGPASPKKFNKLIELVCEHSDSRPNSLIIVPNKSFIPQHKAAILKHSNTPSPIATQSQTLLGQTVITFDDFLTKLIKTNHHRVHIADQELSYYLLFVLIETKHPSFFKNKQDLFKAIKDIHDFFIQIKTCGLDGKKARELLNDKIENKNLFSLFDDYQKELKERYYYDRGDLYLNTLALLKQSNLKLPNENLHLYFSQNYPLHPGQREIIRQLKQNFPELEIHIFYDENFEQENPLLDQAYHDLGDMADESIHYESEQSNTNTVQLFNTPNHELRFITDHINEQIKNGIQPNQMALVVSDKKYLNPLMQKLNQNKIPYSLQLSQKTSEFITKSPPRDLASIYRDTHNQAAAQKLRAQASLDDSLQNRIFLEDLFSDLSQNISEESKERYYNELFNHLTTSSNTFSEQLIITNINHALAYPDRFTYFIGFQFESLTSNPESSIYSPYLYTKKEFAELLESPTYRLRIALEKTKQLLGTCNNILLTSAEFDFSGKPTTPIELGDNFKIPYLINTDYETGRLGDVEQEEPETRNQEQGNDYFKTKKKTFSVSELQEYINCPYKYYAKYHLKLGALEWDDIEPGHDTKGSFVHTVLYRLIKENESDYLEGLEYVSYRKKLAARLSQIIQEELDKNQDFKNFNQSLIEFYAYRVFKTVLELINKEAENFKTNKKKNNPQTLRMVLW